MKLMKRTNMYKSPNVTFNPTTLDAYSYAWWRFVAVVDGLVIFNNYNYSSTTTRHQYKVRALLNELGIKIDLEMPLAKGIHKDVSLQDLILEAEETLCNQYLNKMLKQQEQYQKQKERKAVAAMHAVSTQTVGF